MLLEDVGAEIGLLMALTGVLLAHYTNEPRWDALGSIGIGALLVVIAVVLAVEMKGLLLGEAASDENIAALNAAIVGSPSVRSVIHMRTEHLAPDDLLVAAKVEFDPELTMAELARAIDGVEVAMRQAVPIARLAFIEPDILRPASQSGVDR